MVTMLMDFWSECIRDPRRVGAIIPSGNPLASSIVKEVLDEDPGFVMELGAGTGVITRKLHAMRHHFLGLLVIERSERLAIKLRSQFPDLDIRDICASAINQLNFIDGAPLTIVSSLPFQSLPRDESDAISRAICFLALKHDRFRLIQYSYALFGTPPFCVRPLGLRWKKKKVVLSNFPPASIWELQKNAYHSEPTMALEE